MPTDVTAVLKAPWDHLQHNALGIEAVRAQELKRVQNAGAAEERVRQDYRGRYAIELLQNAHDACADANTVGEAWLRLTPHALLVANQGIPFEASRIDSLLQLGESSKQVSQAKHHTIGYKGIGFSAVLEITDAPQIISEDVAFGFHRTAAAKSIGRKLGTVPRAISVRSYPFPLGESDWESDAEEINSLQKAGAVTVIRLPLRRPADWTAVESDLEQGITAESLLFMPHLRSISISTSRSHREWTKRAGRRVGTAQVWHLRSNTGKTDSWLLATKRAAIRKHEAEALEDPLWKDVRSLNVAVGVPWRASAPDPERAPQPLHVYFPTDELLGRALLVHGDFYVQSNRRRIANVGPGQAISERVAEVAVDLAVEMAEGLRSHGNRLLRTLAPRGEADGFGRGFGQLLDARLANAKICRSASGTRARKPQELWRLEAGLSRRETIQLGDLLQPRSDLLHSGDDEGCQTWLTSLGLEALSSVEVANRLSPAPGARYDAVLTCLRRWYESLAGSTQHSVLSAMQSRPLLKDVHGRWTEPSTLIQMDPRTPPLPVPVRRPTYQPPTMKRNRSFVDEELDVEVITPSRALEEVLKYLRADRSPKQILSCLAFLQSIWHADPTAIRRVDVDERAAIPVPARTVGAKPPVETFREAGSVYLPKSWSGSDLLERLYGPFHEAEFLALEPPSRDGDRMRDRQFWFAIGVHDRPRDVPLTQVEYINFTDWRSLPEVESAYECPDGHHGSRRSVIGTAIDRLSEVLERNDERGMHALAHHVGRLDKPLGENVRIRCAHSSHPRGYKGRIAPGYQAWLLNTYPWIPAEGGGRPQRFRVPSETWVDVPQGPARTVFPVPRLDIGNLSRLGCPSLRRAPLDRLVSALDEVAVANPDLQLADATMLDACHWLLRKIDSVGRRRGAQHEGPADSRPMQMPAERDGHATWAEDPVIADLQGAEFVPGVAWLPTGQWMGLERMYRVRRASTTVKARVLDLPAQRGSAPLFNRADRENLISVLVNKGADIAPLAFRLGNLQEQRVTALKVTYALDGSRWIGNPPFHLEIHRDKRGSLRGGLLRSHIELDDPSLLGIAEGLAAYLGLDDSADLLNYLMVRDKLVLVYGIGQAELTEARDALRRYKAGEEKDSSPAEAEEAELGGRRDDPSELEDDDAADRSPPPLLTDITHDRSDAHEPTRGMQVEGDSHAERKSNDGSRVVGHVPQPVRGGSPGITAGGRVAFGSGQTHDRRKLRIRRRADGSRPSSGDRPGAGTQGSPLGGSAASRSLTEHAAEDIAEQFLRTHFSAEVTRVADENRGWDLEALLPDRSQLLVEVKGFATNSPDFVITKNELQRARTEENFRMCLVTGAQQQSGEIAWIEKPGELLVEERLEPFQWIVRDWPSAEHVRVTWGR